MFEALHVPLVAASLLLLWAGFAKIRDPYPLHRALRAASLPSHPIGARALGGAEVVVSVLTLASATPVGLAAMAVLYGAFAAFVLYAIARRLPIDSCGCFGANDSSPGPAHVAIDVAAATVTALAAGAPPPSWRELAAAAPVTAALVLAAAAAVATGARRLVSAPGSRSARFRRGRR